MIKLLLPVILLLSSNAYAELYFELAIEGGGETLVETTSVDEINAGSGIKFAAGVQNVISEDGRTLSLSLGYLFDSIDARNGTADFDTLTFDAIYSIPSVNHRFGFGLSYHIGPTYKDDVDGFARFKADFDDALGFALQYGYALGSGFQLGARYTLMDYEINNVTVDADSFGIFLSNGF